MAWKAEVIADSTGKWSANALRFATEKEAKDYVLNLSDRWSAVRDTRVVECDDEVTHAFYGKLVEIPRGQRGSAPDDVFDNSGVDLAYLERVLDQHRIKGRAREDILDAVTRLSPGGDE